MAAFSPRSTLIRTLLLGAVAAILSGYPATAGSAAAWIECGGPSLEDYSGCFSPDGWTLTSGTIPAPGGLPGPTVMNGKKPVDDAALPTPEFITGISHAAPLAASPTTRNDWPKPIAATLTGGTLHVPSGATYLVPMGTTKLKLKKLVMGSKARIIFEPNAGRVAIEAKEAHISGGLIYARGMHGANGSRDKKLTGVPHLAGHPGSRGQTVALKLGTATAKLAVIAPGGAGGRGVDGHPGRKGFDANCTGTDARDGKRGKDGASGANGGDGGQLLLQVADDSPGPVRVQLHARPGRGGDGGAGGEGGDGGAGRICPLYKHGGGKKGLPGAPGTPGRDGKSGSGKFFLAPTP